GDGRESRCERSLSAWSAPVEGGGPPSGPPSRSSATQSAIGQLNRPAHRPAYVLHRGHATCQPVLSAGCARQVAAPPSVQLHGGQVCRRGAGWWGAEL